MSALTMIGGAVVQGLSPITDESFDRYARLVRATIGVPVALVTIVEQARQIFPGAVGLPAPWQSNRETPLTHSFCQYVVAAKEPLVIADARLDDRLKDNLAIVDLQVIAYAGYPLTDARGEVVGALCAIDAEPREWTADELAVLADLAAACSAELALRETRRRAEEAEYAASVVEGQARGLLTLSESLAAPLDVPEVAVAVQTAAEQALSVDHAGLWIHNETSRSFSYVDHPSLSWPQAERRATVAQHSDNVVAETARTGQLTLYSNEIDRIADFPASAPQPGEDTTAAAAYIPLRSAGRSLGTLALAWKTPRTFTATDRALLQALGSYAAQAVQRAQLLQHQTEVAVQLQQAMLSRLPEPDHLELRVRYVPAAADDLVGGDWYDAIQLPDGAMLITVGDVVGHDITAAAQMGQIRNILRGLAWNHPDEPARILQRVDRTLSGLRTGALATLLLGRIEQPPVDARTGLRTLRWANAGHLPPILIDAAGDARVLENDTSDPLLGVSPDRVRSDHTVPLEPGSTLLFYTDGLIETRDADIDANVERLLRSIADHRGLELDDLLDALLHDLVAGQPEDDVALLAVRFHPEDQPRPAEAGPSTD